MNVVIDCIIKSLDEYFLGQLDVAGVPRGTHSMDSSEDRDG